MDQILILLKTDLGISHSVRDEYFKSILIDVKSEIEGKGIALDINKTEDMILISDYAAWKYRNRTENIGMSDNLKWRIRNRTVKGRANIVTN